jgi:hypothetical protein
MSTRSNSGRSKHFDVKLRYVVELVETGAVKVGYIASQRNASDILTHSLPKASFYPKLVLLYGNKNSGVFRNFYTGGDSENSIKVKVLNIGETRKLLSFLLYSQ